MEADTQPVCCVQCVMVDPVQHKDTVTNSNLLTYLTALCFGLCQLPLQLNHLKQEKVRQQLLLELVERQHTCRNNLATLLLSSAHSSCNVHPTVTLARTDSVTLCAFCTA